MKRNHVLLSLMFLFLLFLIVPAALAQEQKVDFGEIIKLLGLRNGPGFPSHWVLFDIMLYLIFFMSFVSMFVIPDKQLTLTLINVSVMLLAVLAKVLVVPEGYVSSSTLQLTPGDFPVLIFNAGMFVGPLLIAGMARKTDQFSGPPKSLYTGIITGLLGGGYFFLFWALEQRKLGGGLGAQNFIDLLRLFHL